MDDKELIRARLKNISQEDLNKLSDEQTSFIVRPLNESCFLKACPGSGKTEVVGLKAAYEIAAWKEKYAGMAIVSFTKNAAKEISERVSKYDGINATKYPHFIGTIDSWLHGYILHPLGHYVFKYQGANNGNSKGLIARDKSYSLIDDKLDSDFLKNEKYKASYWKEETGEKGHANPIYANDYYLTHDNNVEIYEGKRIPKLDSTKLTELVAKKKAFLRDGFATYQDAESVCYQVLRDNCQLLDAFTKRFKVIIVDECQDLSQSQIRLFHLLKGKGVSLFFIGDINQSIYEFRKVDIDKLQEFIRYHQISEIKLTQNFRSDQPIVNICQILERKLNENKIFPEVKGNVPSFENSVLVWEYDNLQELPERFISYVYSLNSDNVSVEKSVILARSHKLLSQIRPNPQGDLNKIELFANALNCWNVSNRTGIDMQNAFEQLGKSLCLLAYQGKGNHQNQYRPEGVESIEWRSFLFEIINKASKELFPFGEKTWSDWVAGLRCFLEKQWTSLPSEKEQWKNVKAKVKAPSQKSDQKVSQTIYPEQNTVSSQIKITTIHKEKGKTYDAVLLVSAENNKSEGGCYEQWIGLTENINKEYIRLGYVASSRPRHLLVWAIKKGSKNKKSLIDMGFKAD